MKKQEVMILGKSYSFFSDNPERLCDMGEELNIELEILKEQYSQFPRDHLLLLHLLRLKFEQLGEIGKRQEEEVLDNDQPNDSGESQQLDLEIDDILNSEF
jgi:cell division protein ZapA (FtsZ GTPase activity inhibitor)